MPKLKSFDTESFEFPINKNKKILFANNKGQKTYIKNRMDRMLSKEPETINWINSFNIQLISLYFVWIERQLNSASDNTSV